MTVKPCDGLADTVENDATGDEEIDFIPVETTVSGSPEPAAGIGKTLGLVVLADIHPACKEDSTTSHCNRKAGDRNIEVDMVLMTVEGDGTHRRARDRRQSKRWRGI